MDCKPVRPPYPWNFPGKNSAVGCHFLLIQGSNLCLLHCRQILYHLSHKGSSNIEEEKLKFSITSCCFCLHNSACSLQSLDHIGHVVSESGDLSVLGTRAYLTHSCPALCNCPALTNLLNHACPSKGQPSPSHLDCCSRSQKKKKKSLV